MQLWQALGHGKKQRLFRIFRPALRRGVKKAHRVELVSKKLTPHRLLFARGIYIQDSAAQRELSRAFHK